LTTVFVQTATVSNGEIKAVALAVGTRLAAMWYSHKQKEDVHETEDVRAG
jgi:hypothetical protein